MAQCLPNEKPIKRILMMNRESACRQGVGLVHNEAFQTVAQSFPGYEQDRVGWQIELSQHELDADLPSRDHAEVNVVLRVGEDFDSSFTQGRVSANDPEECARVQEDVHEKASIHSSGSESKNSGFSGASSAQRPMGLADPLPE